MTLWHNEKGFLLPTPARTPENKLKNKKKVFFLILDIGNICYMNR